MNIFMARSILCSAALAFAAAAQAAGQTPALQSPFAEYRPAAVETRKPDAVWADANREVAGAGPAHAGHAMHGKTVAADPHAGHAMHGKSEPAAADPHAGHAMQGNAGHAMHGRTETASTPVSSGSAAASTPAPAPARTGRARKAVNAARPQPAATSADPHAAHRH